MGKNVAIVMGRCSKTKAGYGVRYEQFTPKRWTATWAFAVKEDSAKREGYDQAKISGTFLFDPAYPGCPHCGTKGSVICGACQKITCWDGEPRKITCPWCGNAGELTKAEVSSLSAGGDR
jgi:hypothetical protein